MTTAQAILAVAAQTAATLAATDPKAAAAVALAPVIVELLHTVEQMQTAGALTPERLQALYDTVSTNVQRAHDEWAAM